MRKAVLLVGLLGLLLALVPATSSAPAGEPKLDVRSMTYPQLAEFIKQNRNKVILVDLWNLGCPPCIASMPHLVELHEKYASKGLVVVSLNLDDPNDDEIVAADQFPQLRTGLSKARLFRRAQSAVVLCRFRPIFVNIFADVK